MLHLANWTQQDLQPMPLLSGFVKNTCVPHVWVVKPLMHAECVHQACAEIPYLCSLSEHTVYSSARMQHGRFMGKSRKPWSNSFPDHLKGSIFISSYPAVSPLLVHQWAVMHTLPLLTLTLTAKILLNLIQAHPQGLQDMPPMTLKTFVPVILIVVVKIN